MRTDIRFSYEEYRALPETGPHYQLVDGDLLMSPAPNFRHQDISSRIVLALTLHAQTHSLGKVLYSPLDVIFSDDDVYQPDIVFISNARRSIIVPEGLRGTPDVCVEILSPSSRDLDLKTKRVMYARYGLPELWIVDPDTNTVQVFRLQEEPHRPAQSFSAADTLNTKTFPNLALKLEKIFEE